jgi:membrane fusion protein (multidrug efflux system)
LIILGVLLIAGGSFFYWKGMSFVRDYMARVETDDAYVTGEPTAVAPRIDETVKQVFVKDNDFVKEGTLLVTLDRALLKVQAEQKRAEMNEQMLELEQMVRTLETNQAAVDVARDQVGMGIAGMLQAIKSVEAKQEQVRFRIASLRSMAASLRAARADLVLAQKDFDRFRNLVAKQSATESELDQKRSVLDSSREKVKAAEEQVQEIRAQLAIGPNYQHPEQVPEGLERTDTEVLQSVATGQQVLAQLGMKVGKNMDPATFRRSIELMLSRPEGWIDQVSTVREAKGNVDKALAALGGRSFDRTRLYEHPSVQKLRKELEEAELKLSYTEIRAPVTGIVNRKSVNPGDHVQVGQSLMSIQPLDRVYVVANFKETQIGAITIGQPVEIYVDAYPKHPLKGRVSGFAAATGSASSLLPAENATGNFVKVVQRVPVRIDLVEPNPRETPLFVGMSVVPEIDIREKPTGPDAGERVRSAEEMRAAQISQAFENAGVGR